jgi:DNA repair exonuclease SbcCD ATPase subunit
MIGKLKERLQREKIEQELLSIKLKELKSKQEEKFQLQDDLLKARVIVQEVAEKTQKQIEFHVSDLVTKALQSVFSESYEFKMKFVQRRNKTECDLFIVEKGNECDIFDAEGGGLANIVNFALRVAVWSLKRTSTVFILDEPMNNLSIDLQNKCSEMMKQLADKLGIQIIMISHLEKLITAADKVFAVRKVKGVSYVTSE